VDELYGAANGRAIDALLANAGHGLEGFWDQNWINVRLAIDTNVTGTIYLLHKVGSDMRTCRNGRILTDRAGASWRPRAQANGPAQGSAATMGRPSNGRYRSTDHFERLV
jgi:short-subunit dehydrogenase